MLSRYTIAFALLFTPTFLQASNLDDLDAEKAGIEFTDIDAAKNKDWLILNDNVRNDQFAEKLQRALFYYGLKTSPKYGGGRVRGNFNYPVIGLYGWGGEEDPWFQYLIMENPTDYELITFIRKNKIRHIFMASNVLKSLSDYEITGWEPSRVYDENERSRFYHEFLGEYPWQRDEIARRTPNNIMRLWLMQLSRFRYNYIKAQTNLEMWQTVAYTLRTQTGICKDSATVLTDLLESRNYDARLVAGYHLEEGSRYPTPHGWVVFINYENGNEYLLESTLDTADFKFRVPPRTMLETDYIPCLQIKRKGYLKRSDRNWTPHYMGGWEVFNLDDNDPMFPPEC